MAALTSLSDLQIAEVLADYGLALEHAEALQSKGTVNSNFFVRSTDHRRYFLRVNEGKSESDVGAEAVLVEYLHARGLKLPPVVKTQKGNWFTLVVGKPVSLFPWIEGHEATPQPGQVESMRVAGVALAELHRAGEDLPAKKLPRNHYSLEELCRRFNSFRDDPQFAEVVRWLEEELVRAQQPTALPSGLIHQDLFPDNVLVDADHHLLAVLDFEQATHGRYVYDLAVALNAWCFFEGKFDREGAGAIVEGYRSIRPLSEAERRALPDEARLAAARFTITRITDVFLRPTLDPALRARKHYRDYVRRLDFWRAYKDAEDWTLPR